MKVGIGTLLLGGGAAIGLAITVACSSSSSSAGASSATQCNVDPARCGAGQTCWPSACTCAAGVACDATNCTAQFTCIAAAIGPRPLDHCQNTIGAATCGEHQACIAVTTATGICLPYCAADRACAANETCTGFPVGQASGAPTVSVCVPNVSDGGPPDTDAGDDSGRAISDGSAEVGRQQ
jgi:hypothetical protein